MIDPPLPPPPYFPPSPSHSISSAVAHTTLNALFVSALSTVITIQSRKRLAHARETYPDTFQLAFSFSSTPPYLAHPVSRSHSTNMALKKDGNGLWQRESPCLGHSLSLFLLFHLSFSLSLSLPPSLSFSLGIRWKADGKAGPCFHRTVYSHPITSWTAAQIQYLSWPQLYCTCSMTSSHL